MSFYEIILCLSAVGAVIGGLDHLLGNRFRLGEKFIEGFNIMSTLAVSSAGIIVLAPVLVKVLQPVLLLHLLMLTRHLLVFRLHIHLLILELRLHHYRRFQVMFLLL